MKTALTEITIPDHIHSMYRNAGFTMAVVSRQGGSFTCLDMTVTVACDAETAAALRCHAV